MSAIEQHRCQVNIGMCVDACVRACAFYFLCVFILNPKPKPSGSFSLNWIPLLIYPREVRRVCRNPPKFSIARAQHPSHIPAVKSQGRTIMPVSSAACCGWCILPEQNSLACVLPIVGPGGIRPSEIPLHTDSNTHLF